MEPFVVQVMDILFWVQLLKGVLRCQANILYSILKEISYNCENLTPHASQVMTMPVPYLSMLTERTQVLRTLNDSNHVYSTIAVPCLSMLT